jgi:hypothetical protein
VLDPVDTSDWTVEDLADHVEEVRGMFLETLESWPAGAQRQLEAAR